MSVEPEVSSREGRKHAEADTLEKQETRKYLIEEAANSDNVEDITSLYAMVRDEAQGDSYLRAVDTMKIKMALALNPRIPENIRDELSNDSEVQSVLGFGLILASASKENRSEIKGNIHGLDEFADISIDTALTMGPDKINEVLQNLTDEQRRAALKAIDKTFHDYREPLG